MKDADLIERTAASQEFFNGKILHLFRDDVTLPNGEAAFREVIRHIGAVAVVPLLPDGRVIVERQFRYPVAQVITEIPAGKLDAPDENPLAAAQRELREETGFSAARWTDLGTMLPAAAYCDELLHLYLAEDLTAGEQSLDDDEFLNVQAVPLDELIAAVLNGEIPDAKTQIALLKVQELLRNR